MNINKKTIRENFRSLTNKTKLYITRLCRDSRVLDLTDEQLLFVPKVHNQFIYTSAKFNRGDNKICIPSEAVIKSLTDLSTIDSVTNNKVTLYTNSVGLKFSLVCFRTSNEVRKFATALQKENPKCVVEITTIIIHT